MTNKPPPDAWAEIMARREDDAGGFPGVTGAIMRLTRGMEGTMGIDDDDGPIPYDPRDLLDEDEDDGGCRCPGPTWAFDCPIPYHRENAWKSLSPDNLPAELIEHVAKAVINADIPTMGGAWPWPEDGDPWAADTCEYARQAARVALKAFFSYHPLVPDAE